MSINTSQIDGAAPALVTVLKEIMLDAQFKQGLVDAAQTAGRALSAAWIKHGGTEALVDATRKALSARR